MVWIRLIWAIHLSIQRFTPQLTLYLIRSTWLVTVQPTLAKVVVPLTMFLHHRTRMHLQNTGFIQCKRRRWILSGFSVMRTPMGATSCDNYAVIKRWLLFDDYDEWARSASSSGSVWTMKEKNYVKIYIQSGIPDWKFFGV